MHMQWIHLHFPHHYVKWLFLCVLSGTTIPLCWAITGNAEFSILKSTRYRKIKSSRRSSWKDWQERRPFPVIHSGAQVECRGWNADHHGNQITWPHKLVNLWGWGSADSREKGGLGMGQCLRYQIHWEDLEEYQVGRSGRRFRAEVGAFWGRWGEWENSCPKI